MVNGASNIENRRDNQGDPVSRPLRSEPFGVDRLAVVMPLTIAVKGNLHPAKLIGQSIYGCLCGGVGWHLLMVQGGASPNSPVAPALVPGNHS